GEVVRRWFAAPGSLDRPLAPRGPNSGVQRAEWSAIGGAAENRLGRCWSSFDLGDDAVVRIEGRGKAVDGPVPSRSEHGEDVRLQLPAGPPQRVEPGWRGQLPESLGHFRGLYTCGDRGGDPFRQRGHDDNRFGCDVPDVFDHGVAPLVGG